MVRHRWISQDEPFLKSPLSSHHPIMPEACFSKVARSSGFVNMSARFFFVGVDVLHLNLSLSDPFLHLEVAPLDVPGSREALAALGVFVPTVQLALFRYRSDSEENCPGVLTLGPG